MSETAPTTAPVVSKEIAPGVKVDSSMTPQQRFEIIKAAGVTTQAHTDHNVRTFANEERNAASRAAQATPNETEQKFRAKSVQWLEDWCNKQPEDWQIANNDKMQKWAIEIFAGRALVKSNATGGVELHVRQARNPDGTYAKALTPAEWEAEHASVTDAGGWIPLTRINKDGTSGYVLPKLVANQQYHKSIFAELAQAKAAGITQAQVSAWLQNQMKRDGWLK